MVDFIEMNRRDERFDKEVLIDEQIIGSEKVKIEEGIKLMLSKSFKEEQELYKKGHKYYIPDGHCIYSVQISYKGEYSTIAKYFVDKEQALNYYKKSCKDMKLEMSKVEKEEPKESMSMVMNGMDLIEKAYISHSPSELADLAKYNHPIIQEAVANNPFTSKETLSYLRRYGRSYDIELMILNNPNVDINYLEEVIKEDEHLDKVLIAKANIVRKNLFLNLARVFPLK